MSFITPHLPSVPRYHPCRHRLLTSTRRPTSFRCAKRRHYPLAIFLPPEGAPVIPDDSDDDTPDEDEIRRRQNAGRTRKGELGASLDPTLERVASVPEGLNQYDTWESSNRTRSVSTIKGRSELMLGADELNESLGAKGTERLRHVLAPDEAFGALFNWNAVISNARELELACWSKVAMEEGLLMPDLDDIRRAEGMAPEAAVQRVFLWGGDWGNVKRRCFRKTEIMEELEDTFEFKLCPGIRGWIANLEKYGINYVICSPLPKAKMEKILEDLKVKEANRKSLLVSSEDEFDTLEQMYLLGALKAGRPPGKCVVFADRPMEITAGHETTTKVVGLIGTHPAYEMKTADLNVSSYDELVIYNIRRLFSETDNEFMDVETEFEQN